MKKVILLLGVLTLGACSHFGDSSCYERVAIAKLTVTEVVAQANAAFEGELLDLSTYETIDSTTTRANNAIDEGRNLCSRDENTANQYLNVAKQLLNDSEALLRKGPTDE